MPRKSGFTCFRGDLAEGRQGAKRPSEGKLEVSLRVMLYFSISSHNLALLEYHTPRSSYALKVSLCHQEPSCPLQILHSLNPYLQSIRPLPLCSGQILR